MSKTLVAALALALVSMGSMAQTAPAGAASTPRIDKRETAQQKRIEKGQASGAITDKEAAHLQKREDHVTTLEDKAKADGTVTAQERKRVRHAERRTSRHIGAQAHDKQASGQ
jgi:Skp family chaperone for outer membrane proteins